MQKAEKEQRKLVFFIGLLSLALLFAFALKIRGESADRNIGKDRAEKRVIILDPGHGGEDPGTRSESGILEKDLNLAIALELESLLSEKGYPVILTRREDAPVFRGAEPPKGKRRVSDLSGRVKYSEENPGALYLSIHMNSYSCPECRGTQIYYQTNKTESYSLAESIEREVRERLQPENHRRSKPGDRLFVLKNNPNTAILIECGFLSCPEEALRLSEKEYQKELSFAVLCGIIGLDEKTE